ncbi:MAG: Phosphoribosylamine--glycine ligase [Thermotoga sp. 50_1627]|nr:MAG: Phosphoribosylamine--glycine ligase [Thermotoga sp. 50_1627]HBT39450.1 phosphoribosylamine--glycine ligase [Pseudothermotoga sp.]
MKALVIGSGGREHALVWKLRQEGYEVFCAPGNGGICQDATCYEAKSVDELLQLALRERIDLTVVGPEAYLAQGVVDVFESHGLKIFGPNRKASQLECSKAYAKLLMDECGIPTARFRLFDDPVQAEKYVERCEFPIVIKADGLAQGKGSYVVMSREEAFNVIDSLMRKKIFGESGEKIVVEEFLRGKEMSMMVLADGKTYVPMMSAMDYKKIYDGDKGPNTGGMGSIAPAPHYSENLWRSVREEILDKLFPALEKRNVIYKGVLYLGLMITKDGPKVLEFNCRFGDPETQSILLLLESDLLEMLQAVVEGELERRKILWSKEKAVCVVLVSGGYPESYKTGFEIFGLNKVKDAIVFHAGTKKVDGKIVTSGGRVLNVCAKADTYAKARRRVYEEIEKIHFENMYYRKDIGLFIS